MWRVKDEGLRLVPSTRGAASARVVAWLIFATPSHSLECSPGSYKLDANEGSQCKKCEEGRFNNATPSCAGSAACCAPCSNLTTGKGNPDNYPVVFGAPYYSPPSGTWSPPGAVSDNCTVCPSEAACRNCSSCDTFECEAGTECSLPDFDCSMEKTGSNSCIPCDEGRYSIGGAPCVNCSGVGEVPNQNKTACVTCPPGRAAAKDHKTCRACPAGKTSTIGVCIDCGPGRTASIPSSALCTECPQGTVPYDRATTCMCDIGTYDATKISIECFDYDYQQRCGPQIREGVIFPTVPDAVVGYAKCVPAPHKCLPCPPCVDCSAIAGPISLKEGYAILDQVVPNMYPPPLTCAPKSVLMYQGLKPEGTQCQTNAECETGLFCATLNRRAGSWGYQLEEELPNTTTTILVPTGACKLCDECQQHNDAVDGNCTSYCAGLQATSKEDQQRYCTIRWAKTLSKQHNVNNHDAASQAELASGRGSGSWGGDDSRLSLQRHTIKMYNTAAEPLDLYRVDARGAEKLLIKIAPGRHFALTCALFCFSTKTW